MKTTHDNKTPLYPAAGCALRTGRMFKSVLALALPLVFAAGCAVGPDYVRPDISTPQQYQEDSLWKPASPADEYPRGKWWAVFRDKRLDELMDRLNEQNLSIIQAEARYRQAQALLKQSESALFPTVDLDAGRTRGILSTGSRKISNQNQAIGSVNWEMDLWGGIRRDIEAGKASQEASLAELASIRLSQQAQLASTYFRLVVTDLQIERLSQSEKLLEESLKLTRNQYNVGMVSDAEVAQAESQLKVAKATTLESRLTRKHLAHAIAVSIGVPPAMLELPEAHEEPHLPVIPAGVPSQLLQRRPDVASAERNVAMANAQIGVAKAAFFPALTLSATGGWRGSSFNDLFTVPNRIWSIGPSLALSVFDAGLRSARTDQAIAVYDEAVATYRQQVLTAFQEVEDYLASQAILKDEYAFQKDAVNSALRSETITLNQYRAGTASYLQLLVAQNSRISAENTLWEVRKNQFTACVSLIAAIGGQWENPSVQATPAVSQTTSTTSSR